MPVGPTELLIIAGVLVLLFGATKLPKLARSMGESARIFKAETRGIREDDREEQAGAATSSVPDTDPDTRRLTESRQQPLDAETVTEHDRDDKKAS